MGASFAISANVVVKNVAAKMAALHISELQAQRWRFQAFVPNVLRIEKKMIKFRRFVFLEEAQLKTARLFTFSARAETML